MGAPPPLLQSPKAPELGAFPLDHFRECKHQITAYYACLQANEMLAPRCRDGVRDYLRCRMDRGLMTPAEVSSFGLPETEFVVTRQHTIDRQNDAKRAGGAATVAGPLWETKYKKDDLLEDDGYEAAKGSTLPINPR